MDRLAALERRNPLANTGMRCTAPGQFEIDGTVTVTGDFIAEGKISNDALTSPVAPGSIYAYSQGFDLPTANTNIVTSTITVPDGFTKAAVSIVTRVYAVNHTPDLDYLYGEANIAGLNGFALPLAVSGNNGTGTNVSPFSTVLDALIPGDTFTVQQAVHTAFAPWPADGSNTAEISGSILWFR